MYILDRLKQFCRRLSTASAESGGARRGFERFLSIYFIFMLLAIFSTSSSFSIRTDLFVLHLAGVQNPLKFLLIIWAVSKLWLGFKGFPRTAADPLIIAMALTAIVSSIFSSNPSLSQLQVIDLITFIGFFYFCLEMIRDRDTAVKVVVVLLITAVCVVGFNLVYLSRNGFCTLGVLERYPFWTGKIPLGFYNSFLISFLLGLILWGWRSFSTPIKVVLPILFTGSLVSLFFSFTRGSWLTVVIICFIAGVMKFKRFFLYGMLILLVVGTILFRDKIGNLGLAVYNINAGNVTDRFYLWLSALDMLYDHPLLGIGPGTFSEKYLESYQLLESSRWNISYHAHNVFLHMAAEQGYTGLIVFLLFWGTVFRQLFRNFDWSNAPHQVDPFLRGLNVAIIFSIVNYFLWSLTNTSLGSVTKSFYNINVMIWFLAALTFRITAPEMDAPPKEK
jgi:putative inorganic carbon (hco3(-)) transporter